MEGDLGGRRVNVGYSHVVVSGEGIGGGIVPGGHAHIHAERALVAQSLLFLHGIIVVAQVVLRPDPLPELGLLPPGVGVGDPQQIGHLLASLPLLHHCTGDGEGVAPPRPRPVRREVGGHMLPVRRAPAAEPLDVSGLIVYALRLGQSQHQRQGRQNTHRPHEPDLEPPQEGIVDGVQPAAQLFRIPHGLHRPALRLPQRHVRVYLQNGVFMVLQVSGELRRDGLVVRPEADVHAYVVAELADGAVGGRRRGAHARAGLVPARMALTVWVNSTHSSFFSSSRRRPLRVMR